jgi:hypothetical protein
MKKFLIATILLASTSAFADTEYSKFEDRRCMTDKWSVLNPSRHESLNLLAQERFDQCIESAKSEYQELRNQQRKQAAWKVAEKKRLELCMTPYIGMPESQMNRLCNRVEKVNTTQGVGFIHKQFVMRNGSYIYTRNGVVDGIQY